MVAEDASSFCANEDDYDHAFGDESSANMFPTEAVGSKIFHTGSILIDNNKNDIDAQYDENDFYILEQSESSSEATHFTELELLERAVQRGAELAASSYQTATAAASTLYRSDLIREIVPPHNLDEAQSTLPRPVLNRASSRRISTQANERVASNDERQTTAPLPRASRRASAHRGAEQPTTHFHRAQSAEIASTRRGSSRLLARAHSLDDSHESFSGLAIRRKEQQRSSS